MGLSGGQCPTCIICSFTIKEQSTALELIILTDSPHSHFHFDHTGDPTRFPSSTELIVGPGFKDAFIPGFPSNAKSPVLERDYQDRMLREIDFGSEHNSTVIGGMRAFDFFGDGSFYLLDAPGVRMGSHHSLVYFFLVSLFMEPLTSSLFSTPSATCAAWHELLQAFRRPSSSWEQIAAIMRVNSDRVISNLFPASLWIRVPKD